MLKPISKEYFATKVIERLNGTRHPYKMVINGAIQFVKDNCGYCVEDMSDDDLQRYVFEEVSLLFG